MSAPVPLPDKVSPQSLLEAQKARRREYIGLAAVFAVVLVCIYIAATTANGCDVNSDCSEGEYCVDGACSERCKVNDNCPQSQVCSNGGCVPAPECTPDTAAAVCGDYKCVNNKCERPRPGTGDFCDADNCDDGASCINSVCVSAAAGMDPGAYAFTFVSVCLASFFVVFTSWLLFGRLWSYSSPIFGLASLLGLVLCVLLWLVLFFTDPVYLARTRDGQIVSFLVGAVFSVCATLVVIGRLIRSDRAVVEAEKKRIKRIQEAIEKKDEKFNTLYRGFLEKTSPTTDDYLRLDAAVEGVLRGTRTATPKKDESPSRLKNYSLTFGGLLAVLGLALAPVSEVPDAVWLIMLLLAIFAFYLGLRPATSKNDKTLNEYVEAMVAGADPARVRKAAQGARDRARVLGLTLQEPADAGWFSRVANALRRRAFNDAELLESVKKYPEIQEGGQEGGATGLQNPNV